MANRKEFNDVLRLFFAGRLKAIVDEALSGPGHAVRDVIVYRRTGGKVDFEHSMRRELLEETGLAMDDFTPEPGWTMVVDGSLIGQIKVLRARESAKALHARILGFLAREKKPELADIRVVYGPGDFDQAMPRFVTAFLASRFATQPLRAAR